MLDVLFDEAGGDIVAAKKLAGYADTSSTAEIVKGIKEEILEATQMFMARNAPKAAMAMVGGLYDPTELGIRDKMSAAKELLDRFPFNAPSVKSSVVPEGRRESSVAKFCVGLSTT